MRAMPTFRRARCRLAARSIRKARCPSFDELDVASPRSRCSSPSSTTRAANVRRWQYKPDAALERERAVYRRLADLDEQGERERAPCSERDDSGVLFAELLIIRSRWHRLRAYRQTATSCALVIDASFAHVVR